jgi:DNA polymerase-3 subunit epsilon
LILDVETTGTDPRRDQVIEICVQIGLEAGAPARTWRIRPDVEISPGAQAVHGISIDDLAGCPSFAAVADEIRGLVTGAEVLVGYNISFDIDMLQAEFGRLGQPPLDLSAKQIIDPFRLWQQCEPRTLQDAHRRFVGERFEAAHSATADVAATGRVLEGMLRAFGLPAGDWPIIARVCEPERLRWVGPSRHFQWAEEGHVEISFGKHRGTPLAALAAGPERSFLRWILDKDFPAHVHDICRRALEAGADELHAWVTETYGAAPTETPPPVPIPSPPPKPPAVKKRKVRAPAPNQCSLFPT